MMEVIAIGIEDRQYLVESIVSLSFYIGIVTEIITDDS